MRNAELNEAQAGIKIARENINNLRDADDTTFMPESKEELKSLLVKVKEEREKVGLKLNIKKMKWSESHSVMSVSLRPHGLYSLWNSLGQNTGVGSFSLLEGIFPTQG